jgi:hypothetical protein
MKCLSRIATMASLMLLAGCSSQTSTWGQYLTLLQEGYRDSVGGGVVSLEQAAAIPFASLAFRVDGSSEQLLVLATDNQTGQMWTASSRIVLLTREGRIVRSVGLPNDRNDLRALQAGNAIAAPAAALQTPYRSTREADFPDMDLYGVTLNCVTQKRGHEMIKVLGTAMITIRVDERCESRAPRWSFTDSYWLDPESGIAWLSTQHLHPKGTVVQVKILRPPS